MGLFGFGKKQNDNMRTVDIPNDLTQTQIQQPTTGILNLKKNDILDLTKTAPTLNSMRVAAGWDVNTKGRDYDLDLCALLVGADNKLIKSNNSCVYYGSKKSKGIYLDGDNLTGEGDGDDETIFVTLDKIPNDVARIIFNVVIYEASSRKQQFGNVKNAFVRIVDDTTGIEVCKYNLTEDGGNNTAVIFAELYRNGSGWEFKAIGQYTKATITDLKRSFS